MNMNIVHKNGKTMLIINFDLGETTTKYQYDSKGETDIELNYGDNLKFRFSTNEAGIHQLKRILELLEQLFASTSTGLNNDTTLSSPNVEVKTTTTNITTPTTAITGDSGSVQLELFRIIMRGDIKRVDTFIVENHQTINLYTNKLGERQDDCLFLIGLLLNCAIDKYKYSTLDKRLHYWRDRSQSMVDKVDLFNKLRGERLSKSFPRSTVWSRSLNLHYTQKPRSDRSERPACAIPDLSDDLESGLSLHDLQTLEEAIFFNSQSMYRPNNTISLTDIRKTLEDNESKKDKQYAPAFLSDITHYPMGEELAAKNYISANIGFVLSKKYQSSTDSFGCFVTFSIEDPEYLLISQPHAKCVDENPHAEQNLYSYMKQGIFKAWLISKLKTIKEDSRYVISKSGSPYDGQVRCYAIVLDIHSTNEMCSGGINSSNCQGRTRLEQHPKSDNNVLAVIKNCLQDAGLNLPSHGLLRMVTRVSAMRLGGWAVEKKSSPFSTFEYEEYDKDIRLLVPSETTHQQDPNNEVKSETSKPLTSDERANKSNKFILHRSIVTYNEVRSKIFPQCNKLQLIHTTFFSNRCSTEFKKDELTLPSSLAIQNTTEKPNVKTDGMHGVLIDVRYEHALKQIAK